MIILSILIPTCDKHRAMFEQLHAELRSQIQAAQYPVEVLADDKDGTRGAKRQRLLWASSGEYVCFIDADDWIDALYVRCLYDACLHGNDAVGFKGWMTTDGRKPKDFSISMHHNYHERNSVYYRFINHLCPVRRNIAIATGFEDIDHGEDYDYALRMRPLIKTETFIDKKLYHYRYVSKK